MEDRMRFVPSRSRTRWLLVSGTVATCVAAVVTGAISANANVGERPAPTRPAALAPSFGPSDAPEPDPNPDSGNDVAPLGDVIRTGITVRGGEVVLYGVPVRDMPGISFGVMAGVDSGRGNPTNRVMANEFQGSDRSPGFHAVQGAMNVDGGDFPTFGYYAGPARKIASGRVTAKQAVWSEDSSIVIFWFDPADVSAGFTAKNLTAFDASGKRLPTGSNGVGVG
jgi:hypothetical protein